MAPSTTKTKLTDAQKKKIKADNKAKANPEKSKNKDVKNLERQYKRGQLKRPEELIAEEKEKEMNKNKKLGIIDPVGSKITIDPVKNKNESDKIALKEERARILALKLESFKKHDIKPTTTEPTTTEPTTTEPTTTEPTTTEPTTTEPTIV